jgi:hypothetical protein
VRREIRKPKKKTATVRPSVDGAILASAAQIIMASRLGVNSNRIKFDHFPYAR